MHFHLPKPLHGWHEFAGEVGIMRSVLLWLIGVPIPIILALALCTHHF